MKKKAAPSFRAATRTSGRILQAATALFADQGFEGTSVDAIVARAKVNKRMVYHYFGSKELLYEKVLASVYERLAGLEIATLQHHLSTPRLISALVELYFDFLWRNPEFVRLLLWENLRQGSSLGRTPAPPNKEPMLGQLRAILQPRMQRREIRSDLDVRQVVVSLIGLCLIYFSNQHTLAVTLHIPPLSRSVLKKHARHVTQLLLHGLDHP
jgi:TetR/AcrR family transcriptional regulator